MRVTISPFASEHEAAVARFNERMRNAHAPSAFLLPVRAREITRRGEVTTTHYVAVDPAGEVRGGMICQEYPAVVDGLPHRVVNISAPLSEGIVNPNYLLVGPALMKHALKQNPRAFVVGMGHINNPLPRLLKAMGWTIGAVPFYFRLLRAAQCARHLAPLRTSTGRRVVAAVAASTGVAAAAAAVAHRTATSTRQLAQSIHREPVTVWDDLLDRAWRDFASDVGFSVERTRGTFPCFYPLDGAGPKAWRLTRAGMTIGWFGLIVTRMSQNQHFGDLTVATLTDCIGTVAARRAGMVHAVAEARAAGADILITNLQHQAFRQYCREAGWREGPSNFLFAASPGLANDVNGRSYVSRLDGDGLANLGG